MPKIPYKSKPPPSDEEDEIVSFEAFCGERGAGGGELSLNDNINYRLYYEKPLAATPAEGAPGRGGERCLEKETSLGGARPPSAAAGKRSGSTSFSFGRGGKSSLLGSAAGKPRDGGDGGSGGASGGELGYRRFSERRAGERAGCARWPALAQVGRSGALVLALLCVVSVGVWWAVSGAVGEAWSEEHYRRLWERAHPDRAHYFPSVLLHHDTEAPPAPAAPNFHDHNNLSTKNRLNGTETTKKNRKGSEGKEENSCSSVKDDFRFDCFPESGASEAACLERGCCWMPKVGRGERAAAAAAAGDTLGVPYCFYPPHYDTFKFANMTENKRGMTVYYEKGRSSPYPGDFNVVKMEFKYISDDVIQIKMTDAEKRRFEPPWPELPVAPGALKALQYQVQVEGPRTGFRLLRLADNTTLLDAQGVGGLILSEQLLQLSAVLPTHALYGLGERRGPLRLNTNWQRHTLFNRDTVPRENTNLYGSHPFYLALEDSGRSHGVLLLNSNAMDVILQPAPGITYRTVGGVVHLLVMLGPKPADVVAQYTALVGRPFMPPYWSLGFHLCKFNYGSLNATKEVWKRTRDAAIPFDVQWNDLDYMDNANDFTYDTRLFAELPDFLHQLHDAGMHYVPLIDAGVSASEPSGAYPPYDRGLDMNIFIRNSSLLPFVGKVWNKKSTVWPDFTHPSAADYWREMLRSLHRQLPFDGAWIDMNEPSNFLSGPLEGACAPERLPYAPHAAGALGLRTATICMDAVQHAGSHYDLHNLFALTQAIATHAALTEIRGKRPFIISRSSFVGLGRYAGHWSGDVSSEWHDMQMSIPELLSFSLFGVPMMGADICGFNGNTTVELCKRWMQLGAFYPFSRNHNSDTSIPQDPAALGEEVAAASRASLRLRYTLLPYLYTLFWEAHVDGHTVARPLFFEFPLDVVTHGLEQQFMLGGAVMVAPVLTPGASSVRVYLPQQVWYRLNGTALVPFSGWGTLQENETVLVKGGSVVVLQAPAERGPVSTRSARSEPLQLLVAPSDMRRAYGELYWDDGDSLNTYEERKYCHVQFGYTEVGAEEANIRIRGSNIKTAVAWWGYGAPPVDSVIAMDQERPSAVVLMLHGARASTSVPFTYHEPTRLLTIHTRTLSLADPFHLRWY